MADVGEGREAQRGLGLISASPVSSLNFQVPSQNSSCRAKVADQQMC